MEEKARQILRAGLRDDASPGVGLVERVRARFAEFGDVELRLAPREPMRTLSPLGARSIDKPSRPAAARVRT